SAGILNTDVSRSPFPLEVPLVVLALGVAVPLLVALGPVRRAARVTVAECMSDGPSPVLLSSLDRALALFPGMPRPLALLLRGTFARRAQLALGLALFSIAGAVFMAALNVGEDWRRSVREDFSRRPYDLMVTFEDRLAVADVRELLSTVPAVTASECWPGSSPWLLGANGVASVTTALVGPDSGSAMFRPRVIEGRGWERGAAEGVLVNQVVAKLAGGIRPGDSVRVRLRGRMLALPVAGIVRELAPMPVIYAAREVVLRANGQSPDSTRNVRVALRANSDADQRAAVRAIEAECERRGITLGHVQRMEDAKQGILDHLVIILSILTLASAVVVFVGSLALATTLTLGVVQRTREFAVMKAIGATPAMLARMVWLEGLLLGVAGWALASLLTVPLSIALEQACGRIFFQAPLDPYLWPASHAIWLALVLTLSTLGSLVPARRAARLSVREAFARD
ncbi:MAG: ABC transporter permease, partial [Candidatus Eisenbacteria bacterium]|nr:ABC transporter permease [Candidatus Eisenbacteria bacterium]